MLTRKTFLSFALTACLATVGISAGATEQPTTYQSPQNALDALLEAVVSGEDLALLVVFGTDAADLLNTEDPIEEAQNTLEFLQLYADGYRFRAEDNDQTWLLLGEDGWPFPIPLARTETGWAFDVEEGRDELLFRHIGLNELDAMEMMEAYVAAQSAFRQTDHDGDGVMEFAAGILPTEEGARDGLFWEDPDSILGELIAAASLDGYFDGEEDQSPEPLGGYYYRVLSSQGEDAPGGAIEYIINGNKVAGHALLAVPADYGESGVNSFMVSENGRLYEADLGEDTLDIAIGILAFNPSNPWRIMD